MLPTKLRSCGRAARSRAPRRSTRRPTSAARSISSDLVAVAAPSCSRRSRAPWSRRRATPRRSRTAPRCPGRRRTAAPSRRAAISVGVPVGPIRITGSPGLQHRAQVARAAHLEHDDRDQALLAVHPGAGQREALHLQCACRARPAASDLEVLQAVELARAGSLRAASGARTTTSTMVGVRRSHVAATVATQLVGRARRRTPARRRPARRRARGEHAATPPGSPAWRSPSPSRRCRSRTDAGRRRS